MDDELQKASMWKRISAFLFDFIMLGIVAVLIGWGLSALTGYDNYSRTVTESYARYSGKVAPVCVTTGPGGTNTLTGVLGAWLDSIS